jgi:ABC-type Fe3+-siderophore transport system permease subunit
MTRFFGFTHRTRRPRVWVAGLFVMLSWVVVWTVVARTVYGLSSVRLILLGAAVSFIFVAASASAIAVKRLYDRYAGDSELPTLAGPTGRFRPGL